MIALSPIDLNKLQKEFDKVRNKEMPFFDLFSV